MSRRGAVWGAGAGVVLAAITAVLINELHAGWPRWIAYAVAVALSAALTMRLASASSTGRWWPSRTDPGAIAVQGDISGPINVKVRGAESRPQANPDHDSSQIGTGSVVVGGSISAPVDVDVGPGSPTTRPSSPGTASTPPQS